MLKKDDFIVAAYAKSASGPGWANSPLWVVIKNNQGSFREECLQPEQQTKEMRLLYRMSETINDAMIREVENKFKNRKFGRNS